MFPTAALRHIYELRHSSMRCSAASLFFPETDRSCVKLNRADCARREVTYRNSIVHLDHFQNKKKTYIVSGSCRNTKIEETDEISEISAHLLYQLAACSASAVLSVGYAVAYVCGFCTFYSSVTEMHSNYANALL